MFCLAAGVLLNLPVVWSVQPLQELLNTSSLSVNIVDRQESAVCTVASIDVSFITAFSSTFIYHIKRHLIATRKYCI